jgi:hypothetical protein
MPGFWFDEYPSREVREMRAAWRAHYIAKGCNRYKASDLASKKTHTWPPGAA